MNSLYVWPPNWLADQNRHDPVGIKIVEDTGGTSADSVTWISFKNDGPPKHNLVMLSTHIRPIFQPHISTTYFNHIFQDISTNHHVSPRFCCTFWEFIATAEIVAEEQKYLYEPFELVTNSRRRLQAQRFKGGGWVKLKLGFKRAIRAEITYGL